MSIRLSEQPKNLTPLQASEDRSVSQLYLTGRHFAAKKTDAGLRRSIEYFREVIKVDPKHALAYSGLAESYALLGSHGAAPPLQTYSVSKTSALMALQLDGSLSEPRASLGLVYFYYEWDWQRAEQEFRRAIDLNPKFAAAHERYAMVLAAKGNVEGALDQARIAQELDPASL